MMLVYMEFTGCIAFSPFMEGMQVFYREHLDIRYVQLCIVISLIYFGIYLLLGSLLILIFYGNSGNFAYILPLTFALGPVSTLLRGFMVIEDRLNMTYIIDFIAVSLQVVILSMFSKITFNHLLLLHFTGHTFKLIGSLLFVWLGMKKKLMNLKVIFLKNLRNDLWIYARPLFYIRSISPFYKSADRVIYSFFLNSDQLGILNFIISVFNKVKLLYKSWFSIRLPHLFKDAFKSNSLILILREIKKVKFLAIMIITIFVINIFLYQSDVFQFEQEKWNILFSYARFLIIPILFQIYFGMANAILRAKKQTKALASLSVVSIILFFTVASTSTYFFNFNGAFFSTLIFRESWSSAATFILLIYLYRKSNKEPNIII